LEDNYNNKFVVNYNMKKIELSQGKFAMVDDEDFEFLSQWKWSAVKKDDNKFYAVRGVWVTEKKNNIIVYMHRVLLGIPTLNIEGDHADGDTLNNQKYNLRISTSSQNKANRYSHRNASSKYLGVSWSNTRKKWAVQICKDRKTKFLGYFDNEVDAALAYNKKASEVHGEFAKLNKTG
jgi:hypothetical protein